MRVEVRMPRLGETVDEVVLLEWLVEVGSQVEEGAELALVETDKVETEVPSPWRGPLPNSQCRRMPTSTPAR